MSEAKQQAAKICIAICTFNRAESLRITLESFVQQTAVSDGAWALWVVDNNSSDHTKEVCESYAHRLPVTYLFEAEQGLSAARNAMVRICRSNYLFFTDDDVSVDRTWVSELVAATKKHPQAGYFGGKILPRWDVPRPRWLKNLETPLIGSLYCYFNMGDQERLFSLNDPMPFGASMGFKLASLKRAGPFSTELGPKALVPGRGDDAEMILRLRRMGVKGIYLPNAMCYHEFSKYRFSIGYLYRYGVEKGRAAALMNGAESGGLPTQFSFAMRGLVQLLRGRGDRFRQCVINMGIQRGLALEHQRGRFSE